MTMQTRSLGRTLVIAIPMIWLGVFFLLPFVFMFVLSFSKPEIAMPPYQPVIFWKDAALQVKAHMVNYERLLTNATYIRTYLDSIKVAFISTLFTLVIGFPMAFAIARSTGTKRILMLMLVILPFWTSFLLRVYALKTILYNQGPINQFLQWIGLTDAPIQFLNTNFAVYIGITYTYLPFMVLPLYANLVKLENEVIEASSDLGATPFWTFWQIIVPLAMPGIIAGSMLVFIPAIGEFVIPDLLGGKETFMIGKQIYVEYFSNRDWPMAAALSIAMLIMVLLPYMFLRRVEARLGVSNA